MSSLAGSLLPKKRCCILLTFACSESNRDYLFHELFRQSFSQVQEKLIWLRFSNGAQIWFNFFVSTGTNSDSGEQLRQFEKRIAVQTAVAYINFTGAQSISFVMWYQVIGIFSMIFMSMFSSEAADLSISFDNSHCLNKHMYLRSSHRFSVAQELRRLELFLVNGKI